jgi:hypothetical protein
MKILYVYTVQETGWVPVSVWTGAENLASTGIRSPGSPVRSESLYLYSLTKRLQTLCERNLGFLSVR